MNKKNKIILIVTIVSILLIFGGITYAYFTANINNAEDSSTITITGGKLTIVYDNLSNVIKIENIYPRPAAWVEKNFTVTGTNTTDLKMNYRLGLEVIASNFSADELSAALTNTNTAQEKTALDGTPVSDTTKGVPASGTLWFGYGDFNTTDPTEVHKYTLSIYYPDNNSNQNNNQQKSFSAKVVIVEAGTGEVNNQQSSENIYFGWNGTTGSPNIAEADPNGYGILLKTTQMPTISGVQYRFDNSHIPEVCANIGTGQLCFNYESNDLRSKCISLGGEYDDEYGECHDVNHSTYCYIGDGDVKSAGCAMGYMCSSCIASSNGYASCMLEDNECW